MHNISYYIIVLFILFIFNKKNKMKLLCFINWPGKWSCDFLL